MANPVSALVDGVRSLFDGGGRHRYESVPSYAAVYGSYGIDNDEEEEEEYDYNDSYLDDIDGRRRRMGTASFSAYGTTSNNGRRGRERGREPLLYLEPSQIRQRRRQGGRFDSDYKDGVLDSVWARGNRRFLRWTLLATVAALCFYLGVIISRIIVASVRHGRPAASCDTTDHGYQCYPGVAQNWGQYAPFFSVPSELKASDGKAPVRRPDSSPFAPPPDPAADDHVFLPSGCRFTFAQVLSRHGGRDPTSGKSAAYAALVARILETVDRFEDGPDGAFAFLGNYTYRMGADELTRFGELQLEHSGAHFYRRYRSLVQALSESTKSAADHIDPFVRSAGQHRVVLSAIHWIQGFQSARRSDSAYWNKNKHKHSDSEAQHIVLLPEEAGFNNTLSYNGLCTKFSGHAGTVAQQTFAATFVPAITARLNRGLPGAGLSDTEAIYLMDLCPFETIADEEVEGADGTRTVVGGGRRLSPFCHLFSEAEWRDYDYYQTLGKWYGFGDGSALGATQGVGFVNELVARLTESPVEDHTSTNRTMDADPATFPLDARVYADFSHDNDMANIFAALGLYNISSTEAETEAEADTGTRTKTKTKALPPSNTTRTEPADLQSYAASWTVPFAARMYVEKMVCDADTRNKGEAEEYVRILVNDRIMPLPSCGSDQYGRCRLSRFVDSLAFARSGGHWDDCFA
ncbi:hypothetical protein SCUCBS95973_003648 [Sporothrix curviconia]|uniref:3-phytase n=1 Tax=Sporothrix curviconia TaxID=1260050 RepID=A0ABP0BHG0_9PEZI